MVKRLVIELNDYKEIEELEFKLKNITSDFNLTDFVPIFKNVYLQKSNSDINWVEISPNERSLFLTYSATLTQDNSRFIDLERLKAELKAKYVGFNEPQNLHKDPTENELLHDYPYSDWDLQKIWQISKGENVSVAIIDTNCLLEYNILPKPIHQESIVKNLEPKMHALEIIMLIGSPLDNKLHVGIAPECNLYLYSDFADRVGDSINLAQLITLAAYENEIDIINLSWGPGYAPEIQTAIKVAKERGKIIICSAGNDNVPINNNSMAAMSETICVGGVYYNGQKYFKSNFGKEIKINCPASLIAFNHFNGKQENSGTSFSAAILSGFLSLIISKFKKQGISYDNSINFIISMIIDPKSKIFDINKFITLINA